MNFLRLAFILMLFIGLSNCKKNDDDAATCTQADWVGTYSGTIDCDDGSSESVTVTITADGTADIVIEHATVSVTTEYDPLTPSNCNIDVSNSAGGFSVSINASLDGNNLEIEETLSGGGNSSTCTITATRN